MSEHDLPLHKEIPGYDYGRSLVVQSPVTLDELREIEKSIGWSDADAETLRRHKAIFVQSAEPMVDPWRVVIGSQPHLVNGSLVLTESVTTNTRQG